MRERRFKKKMKNIKKSIQKERLKMKEGEVLQANIQTFRFPLDYFRLSFMYFVQIIGAKLSNQKGLSSPLLFNAVWY